MHFLRQLALSGATDIHPGGAAASMRLIEALAIRSGHVVLDIGCGPGVTLVRVAAACGARTIGIDLLPEMLAVASRRARWSGLQARVTLIRGTALALPIATASCDRIYSESVIGIQGLGEPETILREIHRTLKPGGRCVINEAVWRATAGDEEISAANELCLSAFGLRQASQALWRADDWRRVMQQAGFSVATLTPDRAAAGMRNGSAMPARAFIASRTLSLLQHAQSMLGASARRRGKHYRELLAQHRGLGRLIESRMFVLDRP